MRRSTQGKKVPFRLAAAPESQVFLAGSFNDWNASQHAMRRNLKQGLFETTLILPPGRHEYKFVVNGEWLVDPACSESIANDKGSQNSVVIV